MLLVQRENSKLKEQLNAVRVKELAWQTGPESMAVLDCSVENLN